MTGSIESRLSSELTALQVSSMGTPLPEFTALQDLPAYIGYRTHGRLEEILGMPIASDDASPEMSDVHTGQRSGIKLGDMLGRERNFTNNLPLIQSSIREVAQEKDLTENEVWDEIAEILTGSGIGDAMYRTIDRPVGGSYGAREFIDRQASSGIALLVRENIANWGTRRQDSVMSLLGSLSRAALDGVELVIYGGSGRTYSGPTELWRPEVRPFVTTDEQGTETCSLTEFTAAELVHAPETRAVLESLGLSERVKVAVVGHDDPKATGDAVIQTIGQTYGERLRNLLVVEVGNAPAGYTQLAAALILAREFGLDVTEQYLAISDSVNIVRPDYFQRLSTERKSKVQNAATALNSVNGWLQNIARVNQFMWDRQAHD